MKNYKYELEKHVIKSLDDIEKIPSFWFCTSYLNLGTTLSRLCKNNIECIVYIVIPKKKNLKSPGFFITDLNNNYIEFRGRYTYKHDKAVRWACYQQTGMFENFFKN